MKQMNETGIENAVKMFEELVQECIEKEYILMRNPDGSDLANPIMGIPEKYTFSYHEQENQVVCHIRMRGKNGLPILAVIAVFGDTVKVYSSFEAVASENFMQLVMESFKAAASDDDDALDNLFKGLKTKDVDLKHLDKKAENEE